MRAKTACTISWDATMDDCEKSHSPGIANLVACELVTCRGRGASDEQVVSEETGEAKRGEVR